MSVNQGKRRWVDTHWFRGSSYFRISWQRVKTALMEGWQLTSSVYFRSNHDPEPVMASSKRVKRRRRKLEFKVHTYVDQTD